jgi:hypothetical protein
MRTFMNGTEYMSRASHNFLAGAGLAVLIVLVGASGIGAQVPASGSGATQAPESMPPANWPTSPYHALIDGWGRTIPCRCRFNGNSYRLGEIVCMRTHVGTVLTRCDIVENNTSWMPSQEPCVPDAGT